jgi:hypothetical protein
MGGRGGIHCRHSLSYRWMLRRRFYFYRMSLSANRWPMPPLNSEQGARLWGYENHWRDEFETQSGFGTRRKCRNPWCFRSWV